MLVRARPAAVRAFRTFAARATWDGMSGGRAQGVFFAKLEPMVPLSDVIGLERTVMASATNVGASTSCLQRYRPSPK